MVGSGLCMVHQIIKDGGIFVGSKFLASRLLVP